MSKSSRNFINKFVFQILVFLLPTQLTYHFWPDWAFVYGIRVDYLAPVVYLSDLVVLILLITWLSQIKSIKYRFSLKKSVGILAFLIFVVLNIYFAQVWQVALFKWIKVAEMIFLGIYVRNRWHGLKKIIVTPLALGLTYTCLLAIWQFLIQSTVGGVFYYLGERSFNPSTPGIALANFFRESVMRPYSVFPHPNVLAGYILVSLLLLWPSVKESFLMKTVLALGIVTIVISFSRIIWLTTVLIILFYCFKKANLLKKLSFFILISLIFSSLFFAFSGCLTLSCEDLPKTVFERIILDESAAGIFSQSPIIGAGLGNFIINLRQSFPSIWYLQPVHNIFLLVLAETGLIGIMMFYYFLFLAFRNLKYHKEIHLLVTIIAICFLGIGDHYWLTLQQTQLLFAIVLGASFSKMG